jgi:hypothetical protein
MFETGAQVKLEENLKGKIESLLQIFFFDASGNRGIGADMGMLDTAYFLSQVVLSGIMGYIVHMTGTVLSYMVTPCYQSYTGEGSDFNSTRPKIAITRGSQEPVIAHLVFNFTSKVNRKWGCYP